MFEVNLYIEISTATPRICGRHYIYVVEYLTKEGKVCTAGNKKYEKDISIQRMQLLIIIEALKWLKKPCQIRIFTLCGGHLKPLFEQDRKQLQKWKAEGWKKASGEEIKNADLWQQLADQMNKYSFTEVHEGHSYKKWMQSELQKMKQHEENTN